MGVRHPRQKTRCDHHSSFPSGLHTSIPSGSFSSLNIYRRLGDDGPLHGVPVKRLHISVAGISSQGPLLSEAELGPIPHPARQENPEGPEARSGVSVLARDGGGAANVAAHDSPSQLTTVSSLATLVGTGVGVDASSAPVAPMSAVRDDAMVADTALDMSPPQSVVLSPQRVARGGGAASLGSASPVAHPGMTATGGPTLASIADPVAGASPSAGDEVAAVLLDDHVRSGPAGRETEAVASPGAPNGVTAELVAEAVASPIAPTLDPPGPVAPLERASAAGGASHALVPFRTLGASGFASASPGSAATAPKGASEATVWMDALSDVASASIALQARVDTLDGKVLSAGQVSLLGKPLSCIRVLCLAEFICVLSGPAAAR